MLRKILLTSAMVAFAGLAVPVAFVNSNAGSKLYVCATPQNEDLAQVDFEALTWVEVKGMGSHGEGGSSTNTLSYDTWDLWVIQKAKGLTDAGSPDIEVARLPFDPGQIIMRTAARAQGMNYAFKMVRNDPLVTGNDPTIIYNRGIVMGPKRPFGRNEDFDLEVFTIGFNQLEVIVDPQTAGTRPTNTAVPAITGTATVGQTLTLSNGTWTGTATITYTRRWYAGGTVIAGATGATYVLTAAEAGKIIQGQVIATNGVGVSQAFSGATAAVT